MPAFQNFFGKSTRLSHPVRNLPLICTSRFPCLVAQPLLNRSLHLVFKRKPRLIKPARLETTITLKPYGVDCKVSTVRVGIKLEVAVWAERADVKEGPATR